MDNYVTWIPERDGHAPPFWQDGMVCQVWIEGLQKWSDMRHPHWDGGYKYLVPPEAVTAPFDYATWRAEGLANTLPAGVVLPEPTDWAMEVAVSWLRDCGNGMEALAAHIRTHCQPREVPNG